MELHSMLARKQQEEQELPVLRQDLAPSQRDFLYQIQTLRQELALVGELQTSTDEISTQTNMDALLALGCSAFLYHTDQSYGGSLAQLSRLTKRILFPVLRRDLLFSRAAVYASRAAGADAVWLQADLLSQEQLQELAEATRRCFMTPVVAMYSEEGLQRALASHASVLALSTEYPVKRDTSTLRRLLAMVPTSCVLLVEGEDPLWLRGKADALVVRIKPTVTEITQPTESLVI